MQEMPRGTNPVITHADTRGFTATARTGETKTLVQFSWTKFNYLFLAQVRWFHRD